MKRNKSYSKIILAAIFFQAQLAAADNYSQQTYNQVNADLQPVVCPKVPSPYWHSKMNEPAPLVDEPNCAAANVERAKMRAKSAEIQTTTNRITTDGGTALVAPKAPVYNCGSMDQFSSEFQSCQNSYNQEQARYKTDLDGYNEAQQNIQAGQVNKENEAIAQQKNQSTASTLQEIKEKNDSGKIAYEITSQVTMGVGMMYTMKAIACQGTCAAAGTGCCPAWPKFAAIAAGMFILSGLAKKQASDHADASTNACQSLNQITSTPNSCNGTSTAGGGGVQGPTSTTATWDPVTGECSPATAEACKQSPKIGVATQAERNALKNSSMAGALKGNLMALQPDGSVKFKNGTTFKPSDFKDANALMATGLSAGAAKSVMDALGSAGANSSLLAKDLKGEKKDKAASQTYSDGGGTTVVNSSKPETSDKTYGDPLANKEEKFSEDRKPSSEGLAKEFNGELIGVAGDDIFLMMNRRYKLKSEQDSFIAQDRK